MTTKDQKRRDALGLFYESVLKPDSKLERVLIIKSAIMS